MPPEIHLLTCESFRREVEAIVSMENWRNVRVAASPMLCSRGKQGESFDIIANGTPVVAVGCGLVKQRTRGCKWGDSGRESLELCFYQLAERDIVDRLLAEGCWLVSPGWLAGWKSQLESWGLDQPMAREFFAETTSKIVLLDTGIDPESIEHLSGFSSYVGLSFEVVPVGLGHLAGLIKNQIQSRKIA